MNSFVKLQSIEMKQTLLFLIGIIMMLSACQVEKKSKDTNPFFSEYTTNFKAPPFNLITEAHYLPAFNKGILEQEKEIEAIIVNTEPATFQNTIVALDRSGKLLNKVSSVFFNIKETDNNTELQEIAREIMPFLTKHNDNISMNMDLFQRVKLVYDQRLSSGLSAIQVRVVEKYYNDFVRNGAELVEADQLKLKLLNEKLSNLQLKFGENHLAESNSNFQLIIEDENDLAGLPEGVVEAAAYRAKQNGQDGKWLFTIQKPSLIPFLQYADNRTLREKLYRGYFMRGNNDDAFDNKAIAAEMAKLRSERVKLLGFNTHAEYVIDQNMAKTPEKVYEFLNQLWEPAIKVAKSELNEMQSIIDAEGGDFELQSWDWWYYAEKLRKAKYDLDESQIIPYFKLENVRDGMFWVANNLYGITLTPINNVPLYNKAVEVFEVKEKDGSHLGLLYLDYHPRASKGAGAWCTSFRDAITIDGNKTAPLVSVVCNFTSPTADTPALLNFDEVSTLFHEFGHALHVLFTEGEYRRIAGVVPRDYVELPSQIMENWAAEPQVLKQYAKHYKTNEIIPDELIEKIQKSGHFNQGFITAEYLAASFLDLDWHCLSSADELQDVLSFEKASMDKIGLIKEIWPRYRTTYFGHIFDGGYSAGYYVYIWAAVLDTDAFAAFKESGDLFNAELAAKFRQHCLAECGNDEGMKQYLKFRGMEPSVEPLLEKRGLN